MSEIRCIRLTYLGSLTNGIKKSIIKTPESQMDSVSLHFLLVKRVALDFSCVVLRVSA